MSNTALEIPVTSSWIKDDAESAKAIDHLIAELLKARRKVALIWSIEDVETLRSDLTSEECWKVLQHAERKHDARVGLTWYTLQDIAQDLFPCDKDYS